MNNPCQFNLPAIALGVERIFLLKERKDEEKFSRYVDFVGHDDGDGFRFRPGSASDERRRKGTGQKDLF
jgi:hypothetical protein